MCGIQDVIEIINGVVVIVNNIWCVIKVVNIIFFEWEKLSYFLEQVEYWKVLEDVIGKEEYFNVVVCEVGDVEIVEGIEVMGDYCFFYVVYVLLEFLIVIIFVVDDCVDIWIGYQVQQMVEIVVVEISGVDVENVYLYNMFIGGSFGYCFEFDYICQVVEIVIKFKGMLVKLIYFCEEDFVQDFLWYIIIGCGIGKYKDGKVILMNVDICGVLVLVFQMGCMGMSFLMVDIQLYEGVWDYLMLNLNNNRV